MRLNRHHSSEKQLKVPGIAEDSRTSLIRAADRRSGSYRVAMHEDGPEAGQPLCGGLHQLLIVP
jgi:hypothetical protein